MIQCIFNFFKQYCIPNEYINKFIENKFIEKKFITSSGPPVYPINVIKSTR